MFKQQVWKSALRVSLVSVNVFVLLLCLGVFVTGLWTRLSEQTYLLVTGEPTITDTSLSAAVVGVCAALLALVGIVGSFILKSILGRVVLSMYAFVLLFLIMTQVAAGVAAIEHRNNLKNGTEDFVKMMNDTIMSLQITYSESYNTTNKWDRFQMKHLCCGAKNYTDFYPIFNEDVVPSSCCTHDARTEGRCSKEDIATHDLDDIHTKPCMDVIVPELKELWLNLAIVAIVLSVSQASGVVFSAIAIYFAVREEDHKAHSYQKLRKHRRTSNVYTT